MLSVLKRRWKPKRPGGGEPPPPLLPPSPPGVTAPARPRAPNICVEAGRIEFVKPPPDSAPRLQPAPAPAPARCPSPPPPEKADVAKEWLEGRVADLETRLLELESELEAERQAAYDEKLLVAKLQRQLSRKESSQRERERRLKQDWEAKLRHSAAEAERCRTRLATLQAELARMDGCRTRCEQLKKDHLRLAAAYQGREQRLQRAVSTLRRDNESLRARILALGGGEVCSALVERLQSLQRDNTSLAREGEAQRRQYERCLDEVAHQVVKALLTQKGLQEEVGGLRTRVRDLESQNRSLTSLLLQRLSGSRPGPSSNPTSTAVAPRLRLCGSAVWLPRPRPTALGLDATASPSQPGGSEEEGGSESPESGNRDEGYSTMSSDVQGLMGAPRGALEDLQEEGEPPDRLAPEVVLVPLPCSVNRHSFPPVREPQPVIRSWSDSQLCLQLASSAESVLRSNDDLSHWTSGDWWEADYVQHWLRLDETHTALQQQYDAAELEDWSMEDEEARGLSPSCSWSSADSLAVGTHFTRDFYRLVKFESTKSLASTSSPNQGGEVELQSVLSLIAEQQCLISPSDTSPEDSSSGEVPNGSTFKVPVELEIVSKTAESSTSEKNKNSFSDGACQSSLDFSSSNSDESAIISPVSATNWPTTLVDNPQENLVPLVKLDKDSENSAECDQNNTRLVKGTETTDSFIDQNGEMELLTRTLRVNMIRPGLRPVPEEDEDRVTISESLTTSTSTNETSVLVARPASLAAEDEPIEVNLQERSTSKDVIDELNRMIRKGDDMEQEEEAESVAELDAAGCATGWVHLHRDVDLNDPKERANLLDSMLASGVGGSSSSGSISSSSSSDCGSESQAYQHLHRLHRSRRHTKASAVRAGAMRCVAPSPRPSIIGRDHLYLRYGDEERAAVASFDFLEEFCSSGPPSP